MTKITIVHPVGGNQPGDTLDTSAGAAAHLIDNGYAEALGKRAASHKGKTEADDETPGGGGSTAKSA